jgi:hypothetical protein
MSKKIAGLLMAVMFAAMAVYASDVWKDKDFDKWDQKDVDKILKDSPWSKQIQFGGGGAAGMAAPYTATGDAANQNSVSGAGGGGSSRSTSAINGTGAMQGMGKAMNFSVYWYSSRTVREALMRRRELSGGTTTEDARKALSTELGTYQVLVQSSDLGMFGKDEEALKAHSYLTLKSTKEKISPVTVKIEKGQNDRPIAVIYEFPKKSATGEPTINASEKGVEFYTEAGKTPLKVSFDISKMADKQGADY